MDYKKLSLSFTHLGQPITLNAVAPFKPNDSSYPQLKRSVQTNALSSLFHLQLLPPLQHYQNPHKHIQQYKISSRNLTPYLTTPPAYPLHDPQTIKFTSFLIPHQSMCDPTATPTSKNVKLKNKSLACFPLASFNQAEALFLRLCSLSKRKMAHGVVALIIVLSTQSPYGIGFPCLLLTNSSTIWVKLPGFPNLIFSKDSIKFAWHQRTSQKQPFAPTMAIMSAR
jgi:hypothetical protein